jgi:uncharacterized membrane protein
MNHRSYLKKAYALISFIFGIIFSGFVFIIWKLKQEPMDGTFVVLLILSFVACFILSYLILKTVHSEWM